MLKLIYKSRLTGRVEEYSLHCFYMTYNVLKEEDYTYLNRADSDFIGNYMFNRHETFIHGNEVMEYCGYSL